MVHKLANSAEIQQSRQVSGTRARTREHRHLAPRIVMVRSYKIEHAVAGARVEPAEVVCVAELDVIAPA